MHHEIEDADHEIRSQVQMSNPQWSTNNREVEFEPAQVCAAS